MSCGNEYVYKASSGSAWNVGKVVEENRKLCGREQERKNEFTIYLVLKHRSIIRFMHGLT